MAIRIIARSDQKSALPENQKVDDDLSASRAQLDDLQKTVTLNNATMDEIRSEAALQKESIRMMTKEVRLLAHDTQATRVLTISAACALTGLTLELSEPKKPVVKTAGRVLIAGGLSALLANLMRDKLPAKTSLMLIAGAVGGAVVISQTAGGSSHSLSAPRI